MKLRSWKMPRPRLPDLETVWIKSGLCLVRNPIENHLGELWSIFQIVARTFAKQKEIYESASWASSSVYQTFCYATQKEEVLTELPDLIEVVYKMNWKTSKSYLSAQLQQMRNDWLKCQTRIPKKSSGNLVWSGALATNLIPLPSLWRIIRGASGNWIVS